MQPAFPFRHASVVFLALAALAAAPQPAPPSLPDIQKRLASEDFATRQSAEKDLQRLPASQLNALQSAAQTEPDPEVKSRLTKRVEQIEAENLINPPPLSLDVSNASLTSVVAALNKQIGEDLLSPNQNPGDPLTLKVHDLPFWEILRRLDQQTPLAPGTVVLGGETNWNHTGFSLAYGKVQRNSDFDLHDLTVDGALASKLLLYGTPATENWTLELTLFPDPRTKVLAAGPMQIEKMTDQNGRPLSFPGASFDDPGSASLVIMPKTSWHNTATLPPIAGLSRLTEFRALIPVTVLQKSGGATLDLMKPFPQSVDTPLGKITADLAPDGNITFKLAGPPRPEAVIRTVVNGRVTTHYSASDCIAVDYTIRTGVEKKAQTRSLSILVPGAEVTRASHRDVATAIEARFYWVEKTVQTTLSIEYKNVPVPANAPPPEQPAPRPLPPPGGAINRANRRG